MIWVIFQMLVLLFEQGKKPIKPFDRNTSQGRALHNTGYRRTSQIMSLYYMIQRQVGIMCYPSYPSVNELKKNPVFLPITVLDFKLWSYFIWHHHIVINMHFCHLCENIVKHFVRTSLQLKYQKHLPMSDKARNEVCTRE